MVHHLHNLIGKFLKNFVEKKLRVIEPTLDVSIVKSPWKELIESTWNQLKIVG